MRIHSEETLCGLIVYVQEAPLSHDILVFMTGQEEIEALARTCRDIAKHLPDSCGPMVVIPLYASLPPAQQLRVFQPAPKVKETVNMQLMQSSKGCFIHVCRYSRFLFVLFVCCLLLITSCRMLISQLFFRDAGRSFSLPTLLRRQLQSLGSNMSSTRGW